MSRRKLRKVRYLRAHEWLFIEGRQAYHGRNEILRTNLTADLSMDKICGECTVLNFADYMEKFASANNEGIPHNVYFFRQTFDPNSGEAIPKLKAPCYCKTVVNPNEEVWRCKGCGIYLHAKCREANNDKPCPVCGPDTIQIPAQKRALPDISEISPNNSNVQ